MIIKQLSIFVENRMGRMAEITKILGDAGVDIRAMSIADTRDFGILRLIVNRPEQAVSALNQAQVTFSLTDVIAVGIEDRPGAFSEMVAIVSGADISIEYMYAFISREHDIAFVIMRVEQPEKTVELLQKAGVRMLSDKDVYDM